jgi:hypothetical protein
MELNKDDLLIIKEALVELHYESKNGNIEWLSKIESAEQKINNLLKGE